MEKCKQCGKIALLPKRFSNMVLCGKCASLVNYSEWSERIFKTKEDLAKKKEEIISLASSNGINKEIVDAISNYFNEFINDDFITSYDGKSGQKIYLFDKYYIINTKNDSTRDSLAEVFNSFDPKVIDLENDDDDDEELLSATEKLAIAKNLLSKSIVSQGISTAVTLGVKQVEKEKREEKRDNAIAKIRNENTRKIAFQIVVGDEKQYFSDFSKAEIMTSNYSDYELIRFVPNGIKADEYYECKYFFVNTSKLFKSKEIKQKVVFIRDIVNKQIKKYLVKEEKVEGSQNIPNCTAVNSNKTEEKKEETKKLDQFSEIRKYKELLDEGIITNEEFEKKKKSILKL